MIPLLIAAALATGGAGASLPEAPVPDYGIVDGQCRPHERGPAVVVTATGLKDRRGTLRLELFAPVEGEWLGDDRDLVAEGKVFRRAVLAVPASGPVELCVRAPSAGTWSLALIHDRAGKKKFSLSSDGIGFSGNPRLGLSKPKAESAKISVGPGLTHAAVILNYRRGILPFFGPIADPKR